jgi:hypothetical protein
MSRLARARRAVRESLLSASGAPLAGGLSRHIETHDEGTGAHREIGLGRIDQDQFVPGQAKVAFPVGSFY